MLLLYAISPILVYGGELRRPDHQSFAMLLVTIANCAEVDFANQAVAKLERGKWCGVGIALWVSFTNRSRCSR